MKVTIQNYNVDGDKIIYADWVKLTPESMTFSPSYYKKGDTNCYSFTVPIAYPLNIFIETEYIDTEESISVDVEINEGISHLIYPTYMYTHNINDHVKTFFNKYGDDYNLNYCVTSVGLDITLEDSSLNVKWDCVTSALVPEVTMKLGKYTYSTNHSGVVELDSFVDSGVMDVNGAECGMYVKTGDERGKLKDNRRVHANFNSIDEFESVYNGGLQINDDHDDDFHGFEIRISNR